MIFLSAGSVLIDFMESGDPNNWKGFAVIIGMMMGNMIYSLVINNYLHYIYVAGMKARSIVNAVVYRKVYISLLLLIRNKSCFLLTYYV